MSDGQPRAEWIFPEEKKSNKGRIWLIVGLSVLALAIVGTLLFFLLPRDGEPTPSPSPSASSSATTAPSPTSAPTPTSTPTSEPIPTQPPASDPDMGAFVGQVQPWLDDAKTGLSFLSDAGEQEALQIVDTLLQDAGRLSEAVPPSSIASSWRPATEAYATSLSELRSTIESGGVTDGTAKNASSALDELRVIAGL